MASPSISSDSVISDKELVRDAALCLRSFYGSRDVIAYSKFCERFKKNFGYSIKDQLRKSDNKFADLMEKVSATTRTKFKYDADQKMITLITKKTPENMPPLVCPEPVIVPIIQPTPLLVQVPRIEPHAPSLVPQSQIFIFPEAPADTSPGPLVPAEDANNVQQINSFISSVTSVHSTPASDDRLSNDGSSRIDIAEDDSGMNEASHLLTAIPLSICDLSEPPCQVVTDEIHAMTGASQSLAAIRWSTCVSSEPECENNFNQDAAHESTSAVNCGPKIHKHTLISEIQEENMDDSSRQDPKGLTVDVPYVAWSSGDDEPGQCSTMDHFGDSNQSFYYDAEEDLDKRNSLPPLDDNKFPWSHYESNSTLEYNEHIRSQNASATEEPVAEAFLSQYICCEESANSSVAVHDIEVDERQAELLKELSTLCTESYTVEAKGYCEQETTAQQKEYSERNMQDSASARKDSEPISTRSVSPRRDHFAMDEPGTIRQERDSEEFVQKMMQTISIRKIPLDAEVDDKKLRKDAKEECCRMWGNEVENLGVLLCFLKLIHKKDGPLLIDECEQRIESYVRTVCASGDLSWSEFGQNMSVRRMFELRMFRSLGPPNRHKVQPVDCILNAKFRILPKGLLSEVYSILNDMKLSTLDGIVKNPNLRFIETAEEARKEELRKILSSEPDVFLLCNDSVMLADNEECFIITGVSKN